MSDNRGSEVMLDFTDEVFFRLANQNRGHGIFYKAGLRWKLFLHINDLGAMAVSSVA